MSLSADDRRQLVDLARATIAHAVAGAAAPRIGHSIGALAEPRGCFVTLTNRGRLRGCIGTFAASRPLAEGVVEMARQACCDPRFVYDPITPAELAQLDVAISVLSPLEPIADPLKLEIGRHGIYIIRGYAAGCFLPEVATDMGWDAETFLTQCCTGKGGLPPDAWRRPGTQVFVFTTEKFGTEPDAHGAKAPADPIRRAAR